MTSNELREWVASDVTLKLSYTLKTVLFLVGILQRGCRMEDPSPSERPTTVGRGDDRESVRDGIGVDGER